MIAQGGSCENDAKDTAYNKAPRESHFQGMKFLKTLTASILGSLIAFGVLLFFGFLFLMAFAAAAGDAQPPLRSGSVLMVDLSGTVAERVSGDPLTQMLLNKPAYDLAGLTSALEAAAEDVRIEAMWLRPDGLSTGWATLEAIRRSLLVFKESGKPIYASSPTYFMNESEYFLASVADSVFLDPESIFEFNGFAMTMTFYGDLLDKLGVEPVIVRAGNYKGAVEPYTRSTMSDENREQMQGLLDGIEVSFTSGVSASRGMSVEDVRQLMDRDIMFSARDAVTAGLVDALAFNDEIRSRFNDVLESEEGTQLKTISIANYARRVRGRSRSDKISVVHIDGVIIAGSGAPASPFSGASNAASNTIVKALRDARERTGVKALIVRIDSPGGFAPAADAMLREIELTAQEMPVIISMGDLAASGGYWIAMGGDYVIAEANTITGSIGVYSMFFDASDLLEGKIGITFDAVSTGPSADMFSGMRVYSAAERAMLTRATEATYLAFLEKVAQGRNMSVEAVHEIAQGRVWTGSDGVKNGLIDELGGFEVAVARAASDADLDPDEVQLVHYPRALTFFEQMSLAGAISVQWIAGALAAEPLRQINSHVEHLQELIRAEGTVQARFTPEISFR